MEDDNLADPDSMLINFSDIPGSRARLERHAASARAQGDRALEAEFLTQIARCQGLQRDFEGAMATLDKAVELGTARPRFLARVAIERGRVLRSSGKADAARPYFELAMTEAERAGDEDLTLDALHMVALVAPRDESLAIVARGLAMAERSGSPRALHWAGVLNNNVGWLFMGEGNYAKAHAHFVAARDAYVAEPAKLETQRIAEHMIGIALRHLGRAAEAAPLQEALAQACEKDGKRDPYFEMEAAECRAALGERERAAHWASRALEHKEKLDGENPDYAVRLQRIIDGQLAAE